MEAHKIKYGKIIAIGIMIWFGFNAPMMLLTAQTTKSEVKTNIPTSNNARINAANQSSTVGNIEVNVSGKLALCSHSEKGHIILDVKGGVEPYTFRWNNNETVQNRYNLFAGTYTVYIKDSYGTEHTEKIVIQPPYPLIVEMVETKNASCGSSNTGSAKINVKVGRGEPYKVEWSHGLMNKMEATNLPAGDYTATVYDVYNCSTTIAFSIASDGPAIEVQENIIDIACSSDQNGAIKLQVSGGTAPFTYQWSNGKTTKDIEGLAAGKYEVLIQDAGGCSVSKSFEVKASTPLEVSLDSTTDISCSGEESSSIKINVSGGKAPFTFEWSNGASSQNIANLKAGQYQVKVTDAAGCFVNASFEVKEGVNAINVNLLSSKDITCNGAEDGSIEVEISGGVGPFIVTWSDGVSGTLKRENLKAGSYKVSVVDSKGCNASQETIIQEPTQLIARLDNTLDINCATGDITGVAWVQITGGKSPYNIKWNTGAGSREINFFTSSELTIEITDANGCTTTDKMKVNFPEVTGNARLDFEYRKLEITSEPQVFVNDSIQFESFIATDFISWGWDFGDGRVCKDKDPVHTFKKAGEYEVKLTAFDIYGCSTVEVNTVQVLSNGELVVMPNAFTPNGDGLNDKFLPVMKGVSSFEMNIFNHWGEHLYSEAGLEINGWDGYFKGSLLPQGNYVYKITYTNPEGNVINKTGGVTLIR
ncbi:PDK repeat-containing protein [Belliella baltica DSM 15883]|uniref:PDK repeat-containing protein n=1 Tax=Belliella baltica (strain DSM 15883 / CIP 108006 / LMG 21964 / BA134) TaxID=866536 RepID=I3Z434_BELBD|nr:T9SS C-terminal target domain-containing protein [Belliella baltica]AFL84002.1 PDK repeat-containing protein [Belliella baltica DSM 15883]